MKNIKAREALPVFPSCLYFLCPLTTVVPQVQPMTIPPPPENPIRQDREKQIFQLNDYISLLNEELASISACKSLSEKWQQTLEREGKSAKVSQRYLKRYQKGLYNAHSPVKQAIYETLSSLQFKTRNREEERKKAAKNRAAAYLSYKKAFKGEQKWIANSLAMYSQLLALSGQARLVDITFYRKALYKAVDFLEKN